MSTLLPEKTIADLPAIQGSDSVRAVLARYPATAAVFEKHGLRGCGGAAGPDERIDLFATIHRIEVEALLEELRVAALRAPEAEARASAPEPAALYPRFLKASLIATLTLGASFGAYNLLVVHWALGPVPPEHAWIHAGYQLWGFVLLFIMGVSYHALPRFLGVEREWVRLARATWWLAIGALLFTGWGRFGELLPGAPLSLCAGALLQFLAVAGWSAVLGRTWRIAKPRPEQFLRFLFAGTWWWMVAAAFWVADAGFAVLHGGPGWGARWNEAIYAAILYGGTLAWIQGMFLRTGPVFLDLPATRQRSVEVAFWLGLAGTTLAVVAGATRGAAPVQGAGLLAISGSLAFFVLGLRPFARGEKRSAQGDGARHFRFIVGLSFAASLLFALLAVTYAALRPGGQAPGHLLHDGARHAFTLGFVTLAIFAMAGRIVPIFRGADLRWPAVHRYGAYLIGWGLVLREAQVAAGWLGQPWLMKLSGVSGIVEAVGVGMASLSILGTLGATARSEPAERSAREPVPLSADANVGRLIAAHEEALPILIEAGFTPLASPVLRRTLARAVTLRQACRMHGIDLEQVLERLRRVCPDAPR